MCVILRAPFPFPWVQGTLAWGSRTQIPRRPVCGNTVSCTLPIWLLEWADVLLAARKQARREWDWQDWRGMPLRAVWGKESSHLFPAAPSPSAKPQNFLEAHYIYLQNAHHSCISLHSQPVLALFVFPQDRGFTWKHALDTAQDITADLVRNQFLQEVGE